MLIGRLSDMSDMSDMSAECWVLSAECWVLSAECWVLSAECWVLSAECWVLSALCKHIMTHWAFLTIVSIYVMIISGLIELVSFFQNIFAKSTEFVSSCYYLYMYLILPICVSVVSPDFILNKFLPFSCAHLLRITLWYWPFNQNLFTTDRVQMLMW